MSCHVRLCVIGLMVSFGVAMPLHAAELTATWDIPTDGNWNSASNWDTPNFPNNGADTYNVMVDGGAVANNVNVALNQVVTINSLAIDAGDTLTFNNGIDMSVLNAITNNGTILLNSAAASTDLNIGVGTGIG